MHIASNDGGPATLADFAHWRFESSGDPSLDCQTGRRLAARFLELQADSAFPIVLSHAVQSIAKLGRPYSQLEVAFFTGISAALQGCEPYRRPNVTVIRGGRG